MLLAASVAVVLTVAAPAKANSGNHKDFAGLVDIGGDRKMYMECHGKGSPTVVFVSGGGDRAETWSKTLDPSKQAVLPAIAETNRVCVYDRPGTYLVTGEGVEDFKKSRSDPVPQPTTVQDGARDLHALLSASGERGPYVVVGHSVGGAISRHYAIEYPQEVSGLVLIDYTLADVGRGDLFGPSDPALVAVDLHTGYAWRALEGHPSLQPEEDLSVEIEGRPIRVENPEGEVEEPKLGLDPIVIDPANVWVYYGSIHGTSVYRVRAADLLDRSLSEEELSGRVERHGEKAPCDVISIDHAGNVYVTDLENNAVGVTTPNGAYRVLVSDDEHLIWPDGFSYGSDGYLYVAVSQLHRSAVFNAGEETSQTPFEVLRFRPLTSSAVGR